MALSEALGSSRWLLRATLCLAMSLLGSCSERPSELVLSGPTMGTVYTVKIAHLPAGVSAYEVRQEIDAVLQRIDAETSGYRDDSEAMRFNASRSTEWFAVSAELAAIVQQALHVSERSGGAFDITVAPLVRAWGFGGGQRSEKLLNQADIDALRRAVGFHLLQVRANPAALRKLHPDLTIDLNGIAPGVAVDLLAARFKTLRIDNFMIDIGGDIQVSGRNGRNERWRIAVERPVDTERNAYAILQLDDEAVTTSGEYRNYYVRDGHRYSHTIDPRTARPVEHKLASVIVIGKSSGSIDAWATAFNVLGPDQGYELASRLRMPVMFIVSRGAQLEHRATAQFTPHLLPSGAAAHLDDPS